MVTLFQWATCACVTSFAALDVSPSRPLEGHALGEFVQKCEYHRLMEDGAAFAELRSAHLTGALATKAVRRALYSSELNPNKFAEEEGRALVVDGWMTLSFEDADDKRNIVFDGLGLTRQQQDNCIIQLATVSGENGHTIINRAPRGARAEMGSVALIYSSPNDTPSNGTFSAIPGGAVANATEARAQITFSVAGTLTKLALNNTANGDVSHTVRTRINGANASLIVTQTSAGAGFGEDSSNSDSVAAGDEIGLTYVDSGTSPTYSYVRAVWSASSGHSTFVFGSRAAGAICDQTANRYLPFAGALINDGTATEANEQVVIRSASTASHLQVGASNNLAVSTRAFTFRKNSGNGNGVVSFLAGATGIAVDATNTDSLAQDDKIDLHIQPLLATDDITLFNVGFVQTPSSGTKTDLYCRGSATGGGVTRTGSATEHFTGVGGSMDALNNTSSAARQVRMGYTGRFSDPRIYMSSNPYTSDMTVRLRNDTAAQEITVTVTAGGGAGLYTNYGATLDFGPNDDIFVGWVGGTSGIGVVASFETTIEDTSVVAGGLGPLIGGQRNHIVGAGAVLH